MFLNALLFSDDILENKFENNGKLSKIISFQQSTFKMQKYKHSTERLSLFRELNDNDIIELIKDKKTIVLFNKTDLETVVNEDEIKNRFDTNNINLLKISAKEKIGLYEFEEIVKKFVLSNNISFNSELIITIVRHQEKNNEFCYYYFFNRFCIFNRFILFF